MSWHYLPELAAEYSAGTCLDGDASAQLSTTSTQETCCLQDSKTDACQNSQSGTTCEPSTETSGEEWLTLYREAFRAKTFHQPEKEQESKEPEAGYGKKWLELSVKYDRITHSWKTHRCLFDEDLPQSSVTLPKWGTMQSGVLFRLRTAEHPTCENESGYLPTPMASDYKRDVYDSGEYAARHATQGHQDCLPLWIKRKYQILGVMNLCYVEWVNGFPIGWTAQEPLEMHKFQLWQQQHGVG